MAYLREFGRQIEEKNFSKILILWEEYCINDQVNPTEFLQILDIMASSEFAAPFGKVIENALPLWNLVTDQEMSYRIFRRMIDLQTTQSSTLAEEAEKQLHERYGEDTDYAKRLRWIGLREKTDFQGAISYYELLRHMKKGNFVFHKGGWGTGEIMDVSDLREHLLIEFENVAGAKDFSFKNALKTLEPLSNDHFLARRFGNPDALEEEAKADPTKIISLLLQDLGPKTATEIKDEMCEFVIPTNEWAKWWQGARSRLKKDRLIEVPSSLSAPFVLRNTEITQEELVTKTLKGKKSISDKINALYILLRDYPDVLRNPSQKEFIAETLITITPSALFSEKLQIALLLETYFDRKEEGLVLEQLLLENQEELPKALHHIHILALRKRILGYIQKTIPDWFPLFLQHLLRTKQNFIKDYLFEELLLAEKREILEKEIDQWAIAPTKNPETTIWYFQKIAGKPANSLPYTHPEGQCRFFEAFLIVFSYLEEKSDYRDAIKKMYNAVTANQYKLVRTILKESDIAFAKEFLLLIAKCSTFTRHDIKILHSLAEVAHTYLKRAKNQAHSLKAHENFLWTTEEGYLQTQGKVQHLGTVEVVDNAKEIEAARALGDLRENAEYKFALERRSRIQSELKNLSQQLQKARILTKDDVSTNNIDVGSVVEIEDLQGNRLRYTILGPWDANVDKNILSFQSKLAEAMIGRKKGEKFSFRTEEYHVVGISSYFDQ